MYFSLSNISYTRGYSIAADPSRANNAVIVWIDERYGDSDVLMKRTTDGGQTWSLPIRINDDAVGNGVGQDLVWVQFSSTGKLAIAWRDRRLNGPGISVPFDMYSAISQNGGTSFEANKRLSSSSSPFITLGCCNSFIGVAVTDASLIVVWGDYRSNDWEIYVQKLSTTVSVFDDDVGISSGFTLEQNYPNPFNNFTIVDVRSTNAEESKISGGRFTENRKSKIILKVYDVFGREVLDLSERANRTSQIVVLKSQLPSPGIYFYRLVTQSGFSSKAMLLMR